MRNIIHLIVVIIFLLGFVTIVGETRFVPRPNQVHFGSITYPRRWGRWCSNDNECGLGFCRAYMCQCYPGYITWYFMETCAYEQRKKLTAFLVSFFVGTLGVDWFYLSRGNGGYIVAGIIKLLISSGCFVGWPVVMASSNKKSRKNITIGTGVAAILTIISVIWWLIDWIRILANVFYDGHGAPLQPWGDYYFYNRIPYRY
jgi:TM2 domain-containing membrane protein YozV